jgi:hypothetical protein
MDVDESAQMWSIWLCDGQQAEPAHPLGNHKYPYERTHFRRTNTMSISSIRLPASHPFPAEVTIATIDLNNLCRFAERSAEINFIGHDEPAGDKVTVYVTCNTDEARRVLLHSWG